MARAVITGAAGFLGSHLATKILDDGYEVVGFDNLITGRDENLAHLADRDAFTFRRVDVSDGLELDGAVDLVMHLASPASPPDYLQRPLETLRAGSLGTQWVLAEGRWDDASKSDTYVLAFNPGATAARVTVRILRESGRTPLSFSATVPANARASWRIDSARGLGRDERFSVVVQSDQPIAVERTMYSSVAGTWTGGTNEGGTRIR